MSIAISKSKCTGCKKCLAVCPGSLIKYGEDKKAYIKYPKNCWGCTSCLKECKFGAISLYLGADIGGVGSKMFTSEDGDILRWTIEKENGENYVITINRNDSNKY